MLVPPPPSVLTPSISAFVRSLCYSDHEDSTRYVKLLATVFDQSQVFHEWLLFLDSPYTLGDVHFPAQRLQLEEHLGKISEFFYCVLCNMVIRDLKSVLKRYIKHCVRNMTAH